VILVTGASGFVGTRLCEHLRLGLGTPVRAVLHRPERGVRLARLDVELVREADASGCDAVVHLAYATEGTAGVRRRRTAELAREAAAQAAAADARLVHVSTAAVWGFDASGTLDESTPMRRSGHPYVDGKIAAEEAVRLSGAEWVILRPTNVWGPWGPAFTVAPVLALRDQKVALVGDGRAPANLVYVDNLVHAILRALAGPSGVYVVSDGDAPTWRGIYDAYAALGGWAVRSAEPDQVPRPRRGLQELAAHPAARAVARRVLRGRAADRARAAVAGAPDFPPVELAALQTSGVRYRTDAARDALGWEPVVPFEHALRLTGEWLRFARLL